MSGEIYEVSECETCEGKLRITYKEEASWMTNLENKDGTFLNALSFIPTPRQVEGLRLLSASAIRSDAEGNKYVQTKGGEDSWKMFCQKAPWKDSVVPEGNVNSLRENADGYFAFVRGGTPREAKLPMSLNGVLIKFDDKYGKDRFNLFQGKAEDVEKLLQDFLAFRYEKEISILKAIAADMKKGGSGEPLTTRLPEDLKLTTALLQKCADNLDDENKLHDVGLALVSFCQSWDVESIHSGTLTPNFSVPSPLFQTRVIVRDGVKLFKFLFNLMETSQTKHAKVETIEKWFKAYSRVVENSTEAFKPKRRSTYIYLDGMARPRSHATTIILPL